MNTGSRRTADLIREHADVIAARALDNQWERWPGLKNRFTPAQLASTERDTSYHIDFLASSLWATAPEIFTDYVNWNFSLFSNLNLPQEWITGSLEDIASALGDVLNDDDAAIARTFLDSALMQVSSEADFGFQSNLSADGAMGSLGVRYLGALLGEQRSEASRLILGAVQDGVSISDIYLEVLQPVMREIGLLWQTNKIGVAQEHYASAVTQMVMSQLYEYIFDGPKNGRRLVAACVGGELHEMGMRMIADLFEVSGWDTYYVGANTPAPDIVNTVASHGADVLALSATMSTHLPMIDEVIRAVRGDERTSGVRIIVGGYPFNVSENLWRRVGADGFATEAVGAIRVADELAGVS